MMTRNFVGAFVLIHRQYIPLMLQQTWGARVYDYDAQEYKNHQFRTMFKYVNRLCASNALAAFGGGAFLGVAFGGFGIVPLLSGSGAVAYSNKLTKYVINKIKDSDIAKDQLNNKDINIFTNSNFDGVTSTYIGNLEKLGIKDEDNPDSISIYPKNYESKDKIEKIFKKFNEEQKEKKYKITYSDLIKTLMGGISSIVSVISIVLIAFVAISLVVSSIMIAIITYISVLERTKEIGILRAIGASKKDVSRVFNGENLIEGFISGALCVIITFLLDI